MHRARRPVSALRGRSLESALPSLGLEDACPSSALLSLLSPVVRYCCRKWQALSLGCKAANETFHGARSPARIHLGRTWHLFTSSAAFCRTTHLQAGLAEMKHIKEWVCEPGAKCAVRGVQGPFPGRRGCRGVRGRCCRRVVWLTTCSPEGSIFSLLPQTVPRLRWLFVGTCPFHLQSPPPCQRSTL